jgi:dynein heavy chain
MFLLKRKGDGKLMVNFDPDLVRLLREIRYLQLIDLHVPESGLLIYKNVDMFRDINMRLDQIVFMYNSIMSELIDVEKPLLEKNIIKMDTNLKPGIESFKWESNDIIKQFINPCMNVVKTA